MTADFDPAAGSRLVWMPHVRESSAPTPEEIAAGVDDKQEGRA